MKTLGLDVGSLTAKGVILDNGQIVATSLRPASATAALSMQDIIDDLLAHTRGRTSDFSAVCATGYGRFECPLPSIERSEISCHGRGASWMAPSVRGIIDIGGQDSKAIVVNERGLVTDFVMNDKCAAGTGRTLEIIARVINLALADFGSVALRGRGRLSISARCGVFMEHDIHHLLRQGQSIEEIALAACDAVAERVVQMARPLRLKGSICMTGGVAKNEGVVRCLERRLGVRFCELGADPQIAGALGAALFALDEGRKQ